MSIGQRLREVIDLYPLPTYAHITLPVGKKLRDVVCGERAATQHVHGVMRGQGAAVIAVFGGMRDHPGIPLRQKQRQQERLGVAVGGVPTGIGRAVRQILFRADQIFHVAGRGAEEIPARERHVVEVRLKGT